MSDSKAQQQDLVAWSPVQESPWERVGAILCPQGMQFDPNSYRQYLADRLQQMLQGCPDPPQALRDFQHRLESWSLLTPGTLLSPLGSAMSRALQDPELICRLGELGITPQAGQPSRELPQARAQILQDAQEPYQSLMDWAGMLTSGRDGHLE